MYRSYTDLNTFIFCTYLIHDFRDSVTVHKLRACFKDMQTFPAKQVVLVVVFKANRVNNSDLVVSNRHKESKGCWFASDC